jgi:hypothetical protein
MCMHVNVSLCLFVCVCIYLSLSRSLSLWVPLCICVSICRAIGASKKVTSEQGGKWNRTTRKEGPLPLSDTALGDTKP